MMRKMMIMFMLVYVLFEGVLCISGLASENDINPDRFTTVHAGEGAKIFSVETLAEEDIFDPAGGNVMVKHYVEYDGTQSGEVCAGAYVYNDSLTNGDCVEMLIMLAGYSGDDAKKLDMVCLKRVHACPGDNGKFVYTDPIRFDATHTLKAFIWGEKQIVPAGSSDDY